MFIVNFTVDEMQAIECFVASKAYDPNDAESVMQLASVYHSKGDLDRCVALVREAADIEPENKVRSLSAAALCPQAALLGLQENIGTSTERPRLTEEDTRQGHCLYQRGGRLIR